MDYGFYARKAEIRRIVEAQGIPHTYICCNIFTSYLLPSLVQPGMKTPPSDKVTVFGDGNDKGVFVDEIDVAAFTISNTFLNKNFLPESKGDLNDHEDLVKAIKQVDVVISTVGSAVIGDQLKIIDAIKEAGNVKRFLPSEFGNDVDHTIHAVEPAKTAWAQKADIRRAVESQGIPFTYVASNFFAGYFLPGLSQPGATSPPRDKVVILGDGTPKAVFTEEGDIGTYTIRAVDDPRTLNKTLHFRPSANTLSFNELVALWEKKIGKTLEKVYVPEQQVLNNIQETEFPGNILLAINHSVYVKGEQTNFEIDPSSGLEATELYPDVKYTTVDEYLDQFA